MMCYLGRCESSVLKTSLTQSTLGLDECIPTVLPLNGLIKPISIFHNKNLVYFRAANLQRGTVLENTTSPNTGNISHFNFLCYLFKSASFHISKINLRQVFEPASCVYVSSIWMP